MPISPKLACLEYLSDTFVWRTPFNAEKDPMPSSQSCTSKVVVNAPMLEEASGTLPRT